MRTCLFAGAARLIGIAAWSGAAVLGSTANGAAAPLGNTLMGMLPQGFSAANCREVGPKRPELEKVTCSQPSPGPWNSGLVECGNPKRDKALSAVAWSNNTKLVVGGVEGPDMNLLYQWWRANSG